MIQKYISITILLEIIILLNFHFYGNDYNNRFTLFTMLGDNPLMNLEILSMGSSSKPTLI